MKFSINKKLRILLIVILIIVIGGVSFLLYREVKHPGFEEQKITLYSYSNKASADYSVYFKPNELYDAASMDEEQIYLTEFVDHIKANFNYEFSGDKDINLNGTYDIIAKVQGYTTDREDNIINIWEKDFSLVPEKSFKINGETKSIRETVDVSLGAYNDFVTRILEASKLNCQTSLNVIMNINIKGGTGEGEIEETITPSLEIPLNSSMIQITGNREIDEPGSIEETNQVQLPVNRNMVILYGVIIGVSVLAIAFLIFFTEIGTTKDPFEKELRKLFKKHGDRFVALNTEIAATYENTSAVKTIDDLVRIADELGKPIMYKYSSDYKDINRFYVVNEDEIYMLDLNDMLLKEKSF